MGIKTMGKHLRHKRKIEKVVGGWVDENLIEKFS